MMIRGVLNARQVLGISETLFRSLLAREDQGPHAPKKVKSGGRLRFANAWDDSGHVHKWYDWHVLAGQVTEVDLSRAVVGVRQAANILSVTPNVLFRVLRTIKVKFPALTPRQTNLRSDGKESNHYPSWYWADEETCRSWWEEVCVAMGRVGPSPPAVGGTTSKQVNDEVDMLDFLGEGTLQALRGLQDRLNTKNLRAYRRARGETARLPLREVLTLVLGLGFSHWEEVLDGEEDADEE